VVVEIAGMTLSTATACAAIHRRVTVPVDPDDPSAIGAGVTGEACPLVDPLNDVSGMAVHAQGSGCDCC